MKKKMHFFTLVEILTVMAILAILAGIVVGGVVVVNGKNAETQTLATIKALEMALKQYRNETGHIYGLNPSNIAPSRILIPKDIPSNLNGTLWKYVDQKLINSATKEEGDDRYFTDAWGNPLIYRIPGKFNTSSFDMGSAGPDGKLGDGVGNTFVSGALPADISTNYNSSFGKGDDITNFVRNK